MGTHGEKNTWLSCTILLCMLNVTLDGRGRRAREGREQRAYRGLERDREPARQRRQQQGPEARASERKGNRSASKESSRREANIVHVGLKITESKQKREDNSRALEPESRKGLIRT